MIRPTLVALAALSAVLVVAPPAQADHSNCAYPNVCLWDVRTDPDRKYQYRDFGRQNLLHRNVVDHVFNIRNNDSVLLWDVDTNRATCVAPGERVDLATRGWHNRADQIEIRDQATC